MNIIQALEFVAKRLNDQYEADLTNHTAHLDYHALEHVLLNVVKQLKEEE